MYRVGAKPWTAFPVCGTDTFNITSVPICGDRRYPALVVRSPSPIKILSGISSNALPGYTGFPDHPKTITDDYDWQMYDVTGHGPKEYIRQSYFVACNWSGNLLDRYIQLRPAFRNVIVMYPYFPRCQTW